MILIAHVLACAGINVIQNGENTHNRGLIVVVHGPVKSHPLCIHT
jgi:hypothetical protein